jgi:hypothetical protein
MIRAGAVNTRADLTTNLAVREQDQWLLPRIPGALRLATPPILPDFGLLELRMWCGADYDLGWP